jgi:LmbE family N-acetylglucosaminyl deacetylase
MKAQRHRMVGAMFISLLDHITIDVDSGELRRRAVVFSPHPDDECLACAGTILRKKKAGASVKVVQMTDGQAPTHGNLITRTELKDRRRREALNAGRVLGLDESDTYFLEYEDGRLHEYSAAAAERVLGILNKERPDEVFIPYAREPIGLAADHVTTTSIIKTMLPRFARSLIVLRIPCVVLGALALDSHLARESADNQDALGYRQFVTGHFSARAHSSSSGTRSTSAMS